MTVVEYIKSKGLQYTESKTYRGLQGRMECPNCGDPKSFSINLENGAYNCFRKNKCGIYGSFSDFQKIYGDKPVFLNKDPFLDLNKNSKSKKYKTADVKLEPINSQVTKFLVSRGISENISRQFPLGYLNGAVVFQYHKKEKLVGIKYRSLSEKKFWKEKDCISTLWNQDVIKGETLVICEGELDVMALKEYGYDSVSVPSGVSDLAWIENDWDFLERFQQIYIIMDSDEAGQSAVDNIVKRLGSWRCKNVILPFKDINECLLNNLSKEELIQVIDNAVSFDMAELKSCANFKDEIIHYKNNSHLLKGAECGWFGLTEILKGWRDSELTIWSGVNGGGKSTALLQETLNLVAQGKKVVVGSFEMAPRKYIWWMLKQYCKSNKPSDEEISKALEELSTKVFIIDIAGEVKQEKLFEIMEFAARKYGANTYVIDSLMKVSLSSSQSMVYGEQKKFISQIKDFCSDFSVHTHLVAHPRKGENDDSRSGKVDVAGSSDITNLADNVLIMHRYSEEVKEQRRKDGKAEVDSILMVKKNREHGILGNVGLIFDSDSKRFSYEPLDEKKRKSYLAYKHTSLCRYSEAI